MTKKKSYKKTLPIKCAVLLAAKDGERYLTNQLASIFSQVGVEVSLYYSCDHSTDKSRDILDLYGGKNLNTHNKVFNSSAANFFSLITNFESIKYFDYVFLSDQDDIWLPNKMLRAINCMNSNKAVAYSGSYYIWYEKNNKLKYLNNFRMQNNIDFLFKGPGAGFTFCFSSTAFKGIKNQLVDGRKYWDYFRWHDWPIYAIARSLGQNWYIDHVPVALYRQHNSNDTGQLDSFTALTWRLKFLLNGEFRKQITNLNHIGVTHDYLKMLERFSFKDRLFFITKISKMRTKFKERVALLLFFLFGN